MTLDEHLSVLIVDRNDTLTELAQAIARDNPNIECRRLGRAEIVSTVAIGATALDSSSDALYMHLLGLRTSDNNIAPAAVTLGYRQHQIRRGIFALAGITAFAAAAWCAITLFQIFDTRGDIDNARRQTADLQRQYQEVTRQFPAAPTTAENLRRAVEISHKIGATTRTPELTMDLLSQTLDQHPLIVMKSFGWKYDTTEIDTSHDSSQANTAAPQNTPLPGAPRGGKRKESAIVEGEVRPFRGDYREAIDAINRFAETLSKQPNVAEVKVAKLPLNINPTLTLTGNTSENRDQAGTAAFTIILIMKPSV